MCVPKKKKSPPAGTPNPKPDFADLSEFSHIEKFNSGNFGLAFKAYWSVPGRWTNWKVVLKVLFIYFFFLKKLNFREDVFFFCDNRQNKHGQIETKTNQKKKMAQMVFALLNKKKDSPC